MLKRDSSETVNVGSLHDEESTSQEDHEDDEGDGDEREICQVTDFETTEGETVDLYDKLVEMVGSPG
jgi:hypothetical protein